MTPTTFAQCMDIFDWFNDPYHDYLYHIWISKSDADVRIARALPTIIDRALKLLNAHRGSDIAYPEELSNQPA